MVAKVLLDGCLGVLGGCQCAAMQLLGLTDGLTDRRTDRQVGR